MSEATQVPETIGGAIAPEAVLDAMRADGFLPPAWEIGPRPQKLRQARIDLGNDDYVMVEEEPDDRCWVYAMLSGFSGGRFVDGPLERGMQELADTLLPHLVSALGRMEDFARSNMKPTATSAA